MSDFIPLSDLPIDLSVDDAVEATYRDDIGWVEEKLRLGLSVLVECDKQLALFFYRAIRRRLKASKPPRRCVLISGHSALSDEEGSGNRSLMQGIIKELREHVYSGAQDQVLVLPHLDVLTTTTKSGLNVETREAIAMVFENPNLVMLGFKDPLFEIPAVLAGVFAVRRQVIGIPREALPKIVCQREARKFAVEGFNPYTLYKYVSGLNAVRLRQILGHLDARLDYDPSNPGSADDLYREIRQMTLVSDMELPSVDLERDIGGYGKVKAQLREEVLELLEAKGALTDREEISRIEAIVPKGMIFLGPPGTGKTFFAKAMATSLNATVLIVSGPELKSKWVGESEENLRRIFAQARRSAPSIIVFDELDSFATARGTYAGSGVEHSMVNQLLTEMDGFRSEELVFVIGTTNFVESLDPALLRPGRFELQIEIPYPDHGDRRAIAEIYRDKFGLCFAEGVMDVLVEKTAGFVDQARGVRFSGDHINAILRALKREQIRTGAPEIDEAAVARALNKKHNKKITISAREQRTIAIHEAGHAICGHFLAHASAIERISIATEDSAVLGYVIREVKDDKYVTTRAELLDDICMLLGGRVAESLYNDDISMGAYDDLQKATAIARAMLEELGMGETLGLLTLSGHEGVGQTASRDPIAETTAAGLDAELSQLLEVQRQRAEDTIRTHWDKFLALIEALTERKKLGKEDVIAILGEAITAHTKD